MEVEIKIPEMGESVNEATIAAVLKESGSIVAMDEEVIELETEKVNQVLAAPRAGKLTLNVKIDDVVAIGQVIGTIDTTFAAEEKAPPIEIEEKKAVPPPPTPAPTVGEGVRYMEKEFIEDIAKPKKEEVSKAPPTERPRETRKRMSKIRRVIAERLLEAQHTTAMLTTFNEIDMTHVIATRKQYQDAFVKKHGVKLGFMSWFVKGCVAALERIPDLNSYVDGDEIVHREYYDVGIAVGTERGLMVPVVRDCDKLSYAEIELSIKEYAEKARGGTISVDDLRGGGFTITNGGIYGSLLSTPILNPPQSGILGMHKIQERPFVINGESVIRPMMYVALSYDHRIVDGAGAVTFLVLLKNFLENPTRLLIDV